MPRREVTCRGGARSPPGGNARAKRYVASVQSGAAPAGRLIRALAERHVAELARSNWEWDAGEADRVVAFAESLSLGKGRYAAVGGNSLGKIQLMDWQAFLLCELFAWRGSDGERRYRQAWLSVARKNGKTMLGVIAGLYVFCVESPVGGEFYSVAGHRSQAEISWNMARAIISSDPSLRQEYGLSHTDGVRAVQISRPSHDLIWRPLPREVASGSLDGLGASYVLFDEVHAVRGGEHQMQALEHSQTGQRSPLLFGMTTSGLDPFGYWFDFERHLQDGLLGKKESDERTLYIGYHMDPGDDASLPANWAKANPSMGVVQTTDTLRSQYRRALSMPREMSMFKIKQLNEWEDDRGSWYPKEAYDDALIDRTPAEDLAEKYADHDVWAGVVQAYSAGIPAIAWLFGAAESDGVVLRMDYLSTDDRVKRSEILPLAAATPGELIRLPGRTVAFGELRARLDAAARTWRLGGVGYERGAGHDNIDSDMASYYSSQHRRSAIKVVGVRNNPFQMTPLLSSFAQLLADGRLRVERSNILDRQMAMTVADTDRGGSNHRLSPGGSLAARDATTGPRAICYALAARSARSRRRGKRITDICY